MADTLAHRVSSASIFVPLILLCIWQGGVVLFLLIVAITGRGTWEFYTVAASAGYRPQQLLGMGLSVGLCGYIYFVGAGGMAGVLLAIMAVCLLVGLRGGVERYTANTMLTLGGVFYLGLLGSAPLLIVGLAGARHQQEAAYVLIGLLCCIWLTDALAYACGRLWGRRKLVPSISPGKTVVGFMGGLVGGMLPIVFYAWVPRFGFAELAGLLLLCSAGGQLGDLVESAFKRDMGVKDAPPLIPGHGGILDRFDSYLIALPLAYLYIELLGIFNR